MNASPAAVTPLPESSIRVVMATYNGARFLGPQLDSIFGQTVPRVSVTVYDDGSTDDTRDVLQKYAKEHPLEYHYGGENLGPSLNFSRALTMASGDYFALADQDDIWKRDKLAKCLQRMQQLERELGTHVPILIFTDSTLIDANGKVVSTSLYAHLKRNPRLTDFGRLLAGNIVWGCTTFMNRALVDAALPIPACAVMHDAWLGLVAGATGVVDYLDEQTMLYRQHGSNVFGATRPSAIRKLRKALVSGFDFRGYRSRTFTRKHQALELLKRHGPKVSPDKRALIESYVALEGRGFWSRRAAILRNGFLKHSAVDNIELLVRI